MRHLHVVALVAALSGCSFILTGDESACAVDDDCVKHGSEAVCTGGVCTASTQLAPTSADAATSDPVWGCLGNVTWPDEDSARDVTLRGELRELVSRAPLAGFTISSCSGIDVNCEHPRTTVSTSAEGAFDIQEKYGFRGFLQVQPRVGSQVLPAIIDAKPPPFGDTDYGSGPTSLMLPTPQTLQILLDIVDRELESEAGHFFGLAVDCQNKPVRGVSLHASTTLSTSVDYYTDDSGLPARALRETSGNGEAGFVNLKPGPVTLTYSVGSRLIGSITVQIRKGTLTAAFLPPTPRE